MATSRVAVQTANAIRHEVLVVERDKTLKRDCGLTSLASELSCEQHCKRELTRRHA